MNREAVALGTPVYTTFEGRLGAVDETLLREGRMRRLTDPADVARTVAFLTSEASAEITGADLNVNSGVVMY